MSLRSIIDLPKLARLSRRERRLLTQAVVLLPLTALGLRVVGWGRWHGFLARIPPSGRRPPLVTEAELPDRIQVVSRMTGAAAARLPWKATCLEQSLVLWWLLRRQGVESEVRFGVRKDDDRFQAHAWVEHPLGILDESPEGEHRFAPFERPLAGGLSPTA
ncbi:hypothetical protein BH18GEM1_BH18GEM1_07030 [soil metagenome]